MTGRSRLMVAAVAFTFLTAVLGVAERFDPLPRGLKAEYFPNTTWTPPSAFSTLDSQPSTDHLITAWHGSLPAAFSTTWTGSVVALREGTYTFATVSDDGSTVFIDGQLVVDNGGRHGDQLATGSVHLTRGAHAVLIRYFQDGGFFRFDLLWARDGAPLEPVSAWALWPRRVAGLTRVMPRLLLSFALAATEWVWIGLLLLVGAVAIWPTVARLKGFVEARCAWSALRWILAGSLVLNLAGIWWGLPATWVPIELKPEFVLDGLSRHFSHGWYEPYPPFHYYVLTMAMSPMLLLQFLGRVNTGGAFGYTVLVLICRLVSVAAALGTVIAACLCATHAFGKRAGAFAAAIVSVTTPFLYYAKTANTDAPYLFWFALSLVFYLRLLDDARLSDYVLFAASATLAVCTKDQAYGLYLFALPLMIHRMWLLNRRAGRSHPSWRAVSDRRLGAAAITAAVLFAACHNLLFNLSGFLNHVRLIIGPASETYRMFEPTRAGRLELFRVTVHLIEVSLGWPLFLVSLAGLVVAAATRRLRGMAVWLTMPVVSYYFGFINVILYNYDRFVLPMCVVLALFGGLALDFVLMSSGRGRTWCRIGIAGVFAYTLLYAGTVDVLMVGDSRYAVERWMKTHATRDDLVAVSGPLELRPKLDDFKRVDLGTIEDLQRERPVYVVLNADYARAVPPNEPWGRFIAGLQHGTLGYRLACRFRRSPPWPWLPGAHQDLVGARQETLVFSTLRNINPTIEVFERDRASSP